MPSRNLVLRSFGSAIEPLRPYLTSTKFRSGEVIKGAGLPVRQIYFPTAGLVSSRAVLQSGHEIECAVIGRTGGVGLSAALGHHRTSTRYVCMTDGHAWSIGVSQLADASAADPKVVETVQRFWTVQMGYAIHVGICNAMHTAEQRLTRWLTTAADLLEGFEVRMPQEELAAVLGLQRTAVNPVLQRLKADKLIEVSRGRVLLLDPERLGARACECRLTLRRALCLEDDAFGSRRREPSREAAEWVWPAE